VGWVYGNSRAQFRMPIFTLKKGGDFEPIGWSIGAGRRRRWAVRGACVTWIGSRSSLEGKVRHRAGSPPRPSPQEEGFESVQPFSLPPCGGGEGRGGGNPREAAPSPIAIRLARFHLRSSAALLRVRSRGGEALSSASRRNAASRASTVCAAAGRLGGRRCGETLRPGISRHCDIAPLRRRFLRADRRNGFACSGAAYRKLRRPAPLRSWQSRHSVPTAPSVEIPSTV